MEVRPAHSLRVPVRARAHLGVLTAAAVTLVPCSAAAIPAPDIIAVVGGAALAPLLLLLPLLLLPLRRLAVRLGIHAVHPRLVLVAVVVYLAHVKLSQTDLTGVTSTGSEVAALLHARRGQGGDEQPILVDLRMPHTYQSWHVRGALSAPDVDEAEALVRRAAEARPGAPIVVYCYIGPKSTKLARSIAAAAEAADSPYHGRKIAVIQGGAAALRAGVHEARIVRTVPAWLADVWVGQGAFEAIELRGALDDEADRAAMLQALRSRVARRQRPLVLDVGHAGGDQIDAIDAALAHVPADQIVFALADDDERWAGRFRVSRPTPPVARAVARLQPLTGGGWGTIVPLLLVEILAVAAIRWGAVRAALAGETRRGRGWLLLIPTAFTAALTQVAATDPRFHGIDFTAEPLFGLSPLWTFVVELVVLATGLSLVIGNPTAARTERMVRGVRRFAEPLPPLLWRWGPWPIVALLTFELLAGAQGSASLPTLCAALVGVFAPLAVDVALAWGLRRRLRRASAPARVLLRWMGLRPRGEGEIRVQTRVTGHPACFAVQRLVVQGSAHDTDSDGRGAPRDDEALVGAFSCRPRRGAAPIGDEMLRAIIDRARRLRVAAGADLCIDFTARGEVADVRIAGDPLADNDLHETLMQSAGRGEAPRFARAPYDEVAPAATPLTLDVLRARWRMGGAAVRALAWYGVRLRTPAAGGDHLYRLGDAVHEDVRAAEERFAIRPLGYRLRAYVLRRYAAFVVDHAAALGASARAAAERRVERWRHTNVSDVTGGSPRRSVRRVAAALRSLSTRSALWQEKVAIAHRQCFEALQAAADAHGLRALDVAGGGRLDAEPSRAAYELGPSARRSALPRLPLAVEAWQRRWRRAEHLRQEARDLHLRELDAVADLVAQLDARFAFGGDIAFLHVEELSRLGSPRWHPVAKAIAAQRREAWRAAGELALPAVLEVDDLEGLCVGEAAAEAAASAVPMSTERPPGVRGVRAAGAALTVRGVARVIAAPDGVPALRADEILVTRRADPRWVPALRGAAGLVCEQGGALSHAAILAREMDLPAVMGAAGAVAAFRDGALLRLEPDGRVELEADAANRWLPLSCAADAPSVGSKARRLGIMVREGLPVPRGVLLPHAFLRASCEAWGVPPPCFGEGEGELPAPLVRNELPPVVRDVLDEIVANLGSPPAGLIVRSAAEHEDGAGRSFAGLFTSVAGVHGAGDLVDAVSRCWRAAWSAPVRTYGARSRDGQPVLLDLIIQHFVPASVGGVLFTVDPWTRDASAFIVEAARGGPQAVVAGAAPDLRLRVPRDGGRPAASGATELLANAHVDRLRHVGLRLEALFAGHQDIEWLLAGDTLHVLQARDAG